MEPLTPLNLTALTGSGSQHSAPVKEHELVRFWNALLRRKWLFVAIVGIFVLLVGAISIMTPKTYTTTARLMAGGGATQPAASGETNLPILNALMLQTGEQTAETFAELVQQQNIAAAVVSNLNLKTSPSALLGRVSVKPVSNTTLLNLSVAWSNPADSARITNEFAKVFTQSERQLVQSQATQAMAFLSAELPAAEDRMHAAAAQLADFQAKNGFEDSSDTTHSIVSRDGAIQERVQTLTIDRREAQALLRNVEGQMSALSPNVDASTQVGTNPVVASLQLQLSQIEAQLKTARMEYTDAHPTVINLVRQRDALRAMIAKQPAEVQSGSTIAPNPLYQTLAQQASTYKARIDGDSADLGQLEAFHRRLAKKISQLPQQGIQLATLQQRAKLTSDVYQALQQKYNDATVARTTAISDVTIVQPAVADDASVSPDVKRNLLVAPIVGLIIAALTIFLLDYLERTFHDAGDVRKLINLPVIATIPSFASTNQRALPWLHSMTVEAFLHLCVSLRLISKHPLRSLAITSPSIGDGKSTVAWNLAKAMSNVQPPILVIDADMRRASLHQQAECPNDFGLCEVLEGDKSFAEAVRQITPQLHLLTSGGKPTTNPIGLLESSRFSTLLEEVTKHYTMTIIDCPALTCVADGFLISSRTDGAALVIAANTTDERAAKQVVDQFESLGLNNIVGVVLNRDHQRIHDYSDYFTESYVQALPKGSA